MELLETAYPEAQFDNPDARAPLRAVLDQCLERQGLLRTDPDERENEPWLQTTLAGAPLISFRCPLPLREAQLRIRLPRRYPEVPLVAVVEDASMMLAAAARKAIADSAAAEAARLSGELRGEPQCLQVLGEAMRAASDLAEREIAAGGAKNVPTSGGARMRRSHQQSDGGGGGGVEAPCEQQSRSGGRGSATAEDVAKPSSAEPVAGGIFLGRRLIYSHHIIATQKRTGIVKAARELGLGGFSKESLFCFRLRAVFVVKIALSETQSILEQLQEDAPRCECRVF